MSIKQDVLKLNNKLIDERINFIYKKFKMVFKTEPDEIIMINDEKGYIDLDNDIFLLCDIRYFNWVEFSIHKAKNGYDPKYRIVKTYDDLLLAIQNKMNEPITTKKQKTWSNILSYIEDYLKSEPESFNPYHDFDEEEDGYLKGSFKIWHEPHDGKVGDREALYFEFKTRDGNRYGMGKEVSLGGYTIDREACAKLNKKHLKSQNQLEE